MRAVWRSGEDAAAPSVSGLVRVAATAAENPLGWEVVRVLRRDPDLERGSGEAGRTGGGGGRGGGGGGGGGAVSPGGGGG